MNDEFKYDYHLTPEERRVLQEVLEFARSEVYLNSMATSAASIRTEALTKRITLVPIHRLIGIFGTPEWKDEEE